MKDLGTIESPLFCLTSFQMNTHKACMVIIMENKKGKKDKHSRSKNLTFWFGFEVSLPRRPFRVVKQAYTKRRTELRAVSRRYG